MSENDNGPAPTFSCVINGCGPYSTYNEAIACQQRCAEKQSAEERMR